MMCCRPDDDGVLLSVRAQPRASRNEVLGEHGGALKVAVTAPPEDGRANAAVAKTLAKALGIPKSRVTLISGGTSRNKVFRVQGIGVEPIRRLVS
jgi:uncharacterized protein